jgi:hypothetical protein
MWPVSSRSSDRAGLRPLSRSLHRTFAHQPSALAVTTGSHLTRLAGGPVRTPRTDGTGERATPVRALPRRRGRAPPLSPRRRRRRSGSSAAGRWPGRSPPAVLPFWRIGRRRTHASPDLVPRPRGRSPSPRRPVRSHRTTRTATRSQARRRPTLEPPAGSARQPPRTPTPLPPTCRLGPGESRAGRSYAGPRAVDEHAVVFEGQPDEVVGSREPGVLALEGRDGDATCSCRTAGDVDRDAGLLDRPSGGAADANPNDVRATAAATAATSNHRFPSILTSFPPCEAPDAPDRSACARQIGEVLGIRRSDRRGQLR